MRPFTIQWALEEHLSPRARAVQHALVILQVSGVATWDELAEVLTSDPERATMIRRGVGLPLEDLQGLDAYEQTLRGLRRTTGTRSSIVTTIAECATCQRWGYLSGTAAPKSCSWSRGCSGTVVKIGAPDVTVHVRSS